MYIIFILLGCIDKTMEMLMENGQIFRHGSQMDKNFTILQNELPVGSMQQNVGQGHQDLGTMTRCLSQPVEQDPAVLILSSS